MGAPMAATDGTSGAQPSAEEDMCIVKLFSSKEAYVYQVPPAGTAGHRAELWNVEKWLSEVHVKIVRFSNDEACIQLSEPASGELFAECPISLPLVTCVEPVIDSSRYFVVRVVDRDSGRHAFIGLGFRDRAEASDFNAALSEHQSYLERKAAAAAMRKAFDDAYKEEGEGEAAGEEGAAAPRPAVPHQDFSLRPGEKLTLKLGGALGDGGFVSSRGKLTKTFSLMFDSATGGSVAALAPPPPPSRRAEERPMGLSPSHRGVEEAGGTDEWGGFESAEAEAAAAEK